MNKTFEIDETIKSEPIEDPQGDATDILTKSQEEMDDEIELAEIEGVPADVHPDSAGVNMVGDELTKQ